jgi:hypothetical protein
MRYARVFDHHKPSMRHALVPGWEELASYHNALLAELDAGFLRSERVTVQVETLGLIPGCESGARLLVQATDAYRARTLLRLEPVSEDELAALALRPA